jgi:glutamyl-tRNA reductase
VVANRTLSHAKRLAGLLGGEACGLDEVGAHLADVDVVVTSTASPRPVLYAEEVAGAMAKRGGRPLVIVDLAVPRDVEPSVSAIEGVSLYTIDDLRRVTEQSWRHRRGAARCAEGIIEVHAGRFMSWLGVLDAVPAIRRYRAGAAASRDEVLRRARRQLSRGVPPELVLGHLADTLTNKLLHPGTVSLRRAGMAGDVAMLDFAQRLLGIEETSEQDDTATESGQTVHKLPRYG